MPPATTGAPAPATPSSRIGYGESGPKARTIDGELVAKSTTDTPSRFAIGERIFHIKFGNGNISAIEGNKLTIEFDRAGQKRVLDGFCGEGVRAEALCGTYAPWRYRPNADLKPLLQ